VENLNVEAGDSPARRRRLLTEAARQ
jgi:hypothetical protein